MRLCPSRARRASSSLPIAPSFGRYGWLDMRVRDYRRTASRRSEDVHASFAELCEHVGVRRRLGAVRSVGCDLVRRGRAARVATGGVAFDFVAEAPHVPLVTEDGD